MWFEDTSTWFPTLAISTCRKLEKKTSKGWPWKQTTNNCIGWENVEGYKHGKIYQKVSISIFIMSHAYTCNKITY